MLFIKSEGNHCTSQCLKSFILFFAFNVSVKPLKCKDAVHAAAPVGPVVLACLWTVEVEFIQVEAMGNVAPGRRRDAFKSL